MSTRQTKECVMLAAGLSSRMGKWKLMMPWGGGTILDSALASALSFCDRVVLVAGHRGNELALYYQDHPRIDVIQNPHYEAGMFSSVQCGVAALTSSRFFLALGDMPEVTPAVYRTLWFGGNQDVCLIPGHDRGKGHPILLPQRAKALIAHAPESTTLKDVINQIETHVVSVGEQGIHWDVDTPAQYSQVAQWSGRACTMTSK
ncbi:CTP--molybdopterin cytidylyltransferase [Lelliottia aquatilis]|uniref:nucleotidyltransferase family protein n=1 Tax=Lelliottia aquatilis TaxID=2080838 RepID=UPI000CDF2522|nr:NTP transferase domain-containing protein [Lelliottia aquatilis]POZ17917.1 CTP--molybdopterin cytidylyltransferase [Lelliottia aquatilis]